MRLPTEGCHLLYVRGGVDSPIPEMDASQAAQQLEGAIESGDLVLVKQLLDEVVDLADVKAIEREFPDRDPVVLAADQNREQIAVYLVDKQFSTDKCYSYPGEECEPYCYATHEGRKCPASYDVQDLARDRNMAFLQKVLSDVKCGRRRTGESLSERSRISVDSTDDLERQHFQEEIDLHNNDKYHVLAAQLEKLIAEGDFNGIKHLLNPVIQIHEIDAILMEYPNRDPVVQALLLRNEKIAWYLVEKRFPYNVPYFYAGEECDEWCSRLHPNRPCPNQYTALDIAKQNQLRSVQGLMEGIRGGSRKVGSSLKLHRQVSLDTMPIFQRDVIRETVEYRIANQLRTMIDSGDLAGVKRLIEPVTEPSRVHNIEYVFDDRDPVVYAVEKDQPEIADYLIHKTFTFTKPYRFEGSECDPWCYCQHKGASCPGAYTALSLAQKRGHKDLHQTMTHLRQGLRQLRVS